MWSFYGTDTGNVVNPTNVRSIIIGDFKPTANISEADFRNASNTFLAYDVGVNSPPLIVYPDDNSVSNYIKAGSFPTNLIGYNRFNILHRKTTSGGAIEYEYDSCYYEWKYHEAGTNIYYFDAYRKGDSSYSHCPAVDFRPYSNNAITRNCVQSLQLIATSDDSNQYGIGTVRPLWGLNFSSISSWQGATVQFVLGPVIPSATIDEWLKYSKKDEPDAPVVYDPTQTDSAAATTTGYTWLNEFKIVNWSGPWPQRFLIDGGLDADATLYNQYFAWNDTNDPALKYHNTFENYDWAYFNPGRDLIAQAINNEQVNLGSSVDQIYDMGDDTGYFYTGYGIDNFSGGSRKHIYAVLANDNRTLHIEDMDIAYTNLSYMYNSLNPITFALSSKTFSIDAAYPHNHLTFSTYRNDVSNSFYSLNIIRYNGHYYLGGLYRVGSGYYKRLGFCILCQIDNLDKLPNYGGPNPEDPGTPGLDPKDISDIFGDGTNTIYNPNTESIINGNIGDYTDPTSTGSAGDGSAFNPDGTPRDPAQDGGSGTGEKNTNPVDSHSVPNSHDGSMGNGTGDPHGGDSKITDPSSTLPSGTGTTGTVTGSGVLQVFTPSLAELNSFTSELLSSSVLNAIKNYFTTNPMDGIFGLHILPYTGFAGNTTANPRIGTHNFTATLTLASDEFITVDYGTVYIPFVYDGYENYAPFSDAKIFLPFIGTKDIDINIIQGSQCHLQYNISLVTGDIYAYMYCQWAGKWGSADTPQGIEHLMYSWQGNCAATIPLSHLDSTNYISGAMQIAGGITSITAGIATTNPMAVVGGAAALSNGMAERGRTSLVTSGNISGMAAFMGCREPYFIISRPIVAFSEAYNHYLGQRSNAIQQIGQLRPGTFTIMRNVDLANVFADEDELKEIDSILKGGFYV